MMGRSIIDVSERHLLLRRSHTNPVCQSRLGLAMPLDWELETVFESDGALALLLTLLVIVVL